MDQGGSTVLPRRHISASEAGGHLYRHRIAKAEECGTPECSAAPPKAFEGGKGLFLGRESELAHCVRYPKMAVPHGAAF